MSIILYIAIVSLDRVHRWVLFERLMFADFETSMGDDTGLDTKGKAASRMKRHEAGHMEFAHVCRLEDGIKADETDVKRCPNVGQGRDDQNKTVEMDSSELGLS
jgi:hypothetical protein